MKRLLAALLLVASPALSQSNGWREIANGWGEIQTPPGYSTFPAPATCTTAGQIPVFLGSPVAMGCDAGLTYDAATDTLTVGARIAFAGSQIYSPWGGQTNFTESTGLGPGDVGLRYIFAGSGSASQPSYGVTADAGLGFWHSAGSTFGFTSGSVNRMNFSASSLDSSVPVTVGAALGAPTARLTKMGTFGYNTKNLADASATAFETFTLADGETYGGKVIYSVVATKGTALQRLDGEIRFNATREGSTYTATVGTTHEALEQVLSAVAGTLTGGVTIACAAGVCTLSATFDTSQSSPDSFVINYRNDVPGDDRMTAL